MFTYLSKQFWQQAAERAVKTSIQIFVALLSAGGFGLLNAPWASALSTAAMAAVLSLLTSLASEPFGPRQTPDVVSARAPRPTETVQVRASATQVPIWSGPGAASAT
jgi:hypothetical protein